LRKAVLQAGITKRISPHSLRHYAESLIMPS
jgi:site-specific recombinase XerD